MPSGRKWKFFQVEYSTILIWNSIRLKRARTHAWVEFSTQLEYSTNALRTGWNWLSLLILITLPQEMAVAKTALSPAGLESLLQCLNIVQFRKKSCVIIHGQKYKTSVKLYFTVIRWVHRDTLWRHASASPIATLMWSTQSSMFWTEHERISIEKWRHIRLAWEETYTSNIDNSIATVVNICADAGSSPPQIKDVPAGPSCRLSWIVCWPSLHLCCYWLDHRLRHRDDRPVLILVYLLSLIGGLHTVPINMLLHPVFGALRPVFEWHHITRGGTTTAGGKVRGGSSLLEELLKQHLGNLTWWWWA